VDFLLQRIEEYRGIVIITTSLRQNMDSAFLMRIHAAVDFPDPDARIRFELWRGMVPEGISRPTDEEYQALAEQFTMSGGNIKNAVADAAFRAMAEAGSEAAQITIRHLVLGIAREEQKMGHALSKGDFGEKYYSMVEAEILT
jgi:AAA+ superfamily predicted ATPase